MAKEHPLDRERGNIAALLRDWPPGQIESVITQQLYLWGAENLSDKLQWCWNPRLRTTIGRAFLEEGKLELNPLLLGRHPEEMRGVVIHELAHLVVTARYGLRVAPHGAEWKNLMRLAGESTSATHSLNVEGLRAPRRRRARRRTVRIAGISWLRPRKK
ncbi:MAG: SprT-like domain-containing protein [Planctomycetota bacterium]